MIVKDFSLKHTVESGQPLTFLANIKNNGNIVEYIYGSSLIRVEQKSDMLSYSSYGKISKSELSNEVMRRFGLNDNIGIVYKQIATDTFMERAIKLYKGLRITRNPPWETMLSFVISQFNNIKRIRYIMRKIVEAYGKEHEISYGGKKLSIKSFPEAEAIANASVDELKALGTGFRAKYIKAIAEEYSDSRLSKLGSMKYERAKEKLMEIDGIGDKVADCILLFGYGKLNAFPIDTWIKRAIEKLYFDGKKQSINRIHEFAEEQWGAYAGYAQQYLYHFARNNLKHA